MIERVCFLLRVLTKWHAKVVCRWLCRPLLLVEGVLIKGFGKLYGGQGYHPRLKCVGGEFALTSFLLGLICCKKEGGLLCLVLGAMLPSCRPVMYSRSVLLLVPFGAPPQRVRFGVFSQGNCPRIGCFGLWRSEGWISISC